LPQTFSAGSGIDINFDDKDEDGRIQVGDTIATLSVQDVESGVTSEVNLVASIVDSSVAAHDEDTLWSFDGLHASGNNGRLEYTGSQTAPDEVILKSIDFYW